MRAGRSPAFRLVTVLTALAMSASACTSLHPVPVVAASQPGSPDPIQPGDEVRVTMHDGRRTAFVVGAVQDTAIVARDGTHYPHDQIAVLERKGFSGPKTGILIGSLVAGFLFISYAIAVASLLGDLESS
jgi:protein involved in polysaccharide export with SLBB domain